MKRMAGVARKFAECEAKHPAVWRLGTQLADEVFDGRSEYIRQETTTDEGAHRYIKAAGEHLLVSLSDGTLEEEMGVVFPGPITDSSAACFGIAFTKQLRDRFDDEGSERPVARGQCPVCGERVPLGGGKTVQNAHLMYSLASSLAERIKPGEEGAAARKFLDNGRALADSLHNYAHRRTTVNPDWESAGLWTREARRLDAQ
jgi:hypothetical protein